MMASIILYSVLICLPSAIGIGLSGVLGHSEAFLVPVALFVAGVVATQTILLLFEAAGFKRLAVAKFALFFPAFLVMTLFLVIGMDGDCDFHDSSDDV